MNKRILPAVLVLSLFSLSSIAFADMPANTEKCYGVARAGQNDCDNPDPNTCMKSVTDADPNYWIYLPMGICSKLAGGTTTPGVVSDSMSTVPVTAPATTPAPGPVTTTTIIIPPPAPTPAPGDSPSTH